MKWMTRPAVGMTAFLLVSPVVADESELATLKKQLQALTERYMAQQEATAQLEARLRRQEALTAPQGSNWPLVGNWPARGGREGLIRTAETRAAQADFDGSRPSSTGNGEVIRQAPQSASAQAVYQEQSGGIFGDARKFTIETGLNYSHYNTRQLALNGFLALDAIFLGNINVDRIRANVLTWDTSLRYAYSDRLQFDLSVPVVYRQTTYESGGAGGGASTLSEATVTRSPRIGDINVGMYYKLLAESATLPDVVWNVRLKGPTGKHPYGIKMVDNANNNNLKTPTELPTGNGVWSLSSGVSLVKTIDPAILFANFSYFHNFSRHFDDISSTQGQVVPGRIKLGDSFQWGVGMAFAMSERSSLSFSFSQLLSARASTQADGGTKNRIVGSNANAASFNIGLTHALSDRSTMVTSLGIGLTPDAPNFSVGVKFPYSF
ncbi:hypothetical protein [uncultured Azonexus sp.]|uniref:hypothetical protein n=1 Tax=uncultured Azonexus sp. TaxID=520307 RepID=UPI002601A6A7|nr:hypothetical protein [uncultured Azonexus sp.]